MIGVDWGTSSLRAYLLNEDGAVLESVQKPWGIMQLTAIDGTRQKAFEKALHDTCGAWLKKDPAVPILACGMVGSAQGWKEAPYLPIPVSLQALTHHLTQLPLLSGHVLHIVPGLLQPGWLPNVMRGEETQVLGVLSQWASKGAERLWVGLPGTHSKWVMASAGTIQQFDTFMTGEVFAALRSSTILGKTMQQRPDGAADAKATGNTAFIRGLEVAGSPDGGLGVLSNIFSARTLGLTDQLHAFDQADYLSGLLIGHEVAALARRHAADRAPVVLCGEADLCRRYSIALKHYGMGEAVIAEQATTQGLWQIGMAAGLAFRPAS